MRDYVEIYNQFWLYAAQGPWASVLIALTLSVCGLVGARAAARAVRRFGARTKLADKTLIPVAASLARWTIWSVTFVAVLDAFGVETRSVLAFFGAAGIGVGLALKETLTDIAAGIVLLVLRPFDVGDSIEVVGISGTVDSIDFFETLLTSQDGLAISLPNNKVRQGTIINYSRAKRRRADLVVHLDYNEDTNKAITIIRELLQGDRRVLHEPAPLVDVSELGSQAVDLLIRFWLPPTEFFAAKLALTAQIKQALDTAGVQICPLPPQARSHPPAAANGRAAP